MPFLEEYTMLDELGRGGFATVYKVRHNELGYIRAVRVLNETVVDKSSKTYQKFLKECRVLLRLGNGNHPNIVHIYQPRLLASKAMVEMDYVDGMDIEHYLERESNFVSKEEVIRMATQMGSALAYCHEDIYRFCMDRNIDKLKDDPNDGSKVLIDDETKERLINKYKVIHNDIHSGNIMRREDGNFVLLDFGLAIDGEEVVRCSSRHTNGRPEFKSPEKWDDESILTEQSDIYSFGIVLYQYLAGRVPFPFNKRLSNRAEAEYLLGKAHQDTKPPSIELLRKEYYEQKYEGREYIKDYPDWLEEMILKCLNKNPKERFKNGKELYDYILEHAQDNDVTDKSGIEKLRNVVTDLQNENDSLSVELNKKTLSLTRKQDELTKLQQTLLDLHKKLERQRSNLANKKTLIFFLLVVALCGGVLSFYFYSNHSDESSTVCELKTTMEQKDKQIEEYKVEIKTLNNLISSDKKASEIRQLKVNISKKDEQIRNLASDLTKKKDKAKSLARAVSDKEGQISKLNSELNSANREKKELQSALDKANREIKMLANTNTSTASNDAEIRKLKEQVQQKNTEISRLNSELNSANRTKKELQTALDKANREIKLLQQ